MSVVGAVSWGSTPPLPDDFHLFLYTGSDQTATCPVGYSTAVIELYSAGQLGGADVGHTFASFAVVPGDVVHALVGGTTSTSYPDGGHGAPGSTAVYLNGTTFPGDLMVIAGAPGAGTGIVIGGHGGDPDGTNATGSGGGGGATQAAPGAGGVAGGFTSGSAGTFGHGGNPGFTGGVFVGGGGGGGYYGGGGGATNGAGGGGGSSYADPACTGITYSTAPVSDISPSYTGVATVTFTV